MVSAAVSIERQEIDVSAISGPYLAPNDEEFDPAHAGIFSDHVLETLL